jgi:two-component system chemotaxis response regulator CheY
MNTHRLERILVVDDEPFIRRTVRSILGIVGQFELEEAADGESAFTMVSSFRPDVVFCDVGMAPMDGFAFLEKLRHHEDAVLRKTRIVMLTGDASETTVKTALRLKPDGYLIKPVSPRKMAALLESMFGLH